MGSGNSPSRRAEFWDTLSTSQYAEGTQCHDGIDNDGDALIDENDLGCASPCDTSESPSEYGNRLTCMPGDNSRLGSGDQRCLTECFLAAALTTNVDVDEGGPVCAPAPESCDGLDNDCDGLVDEGCPVCALELCDGLDNDCDGQVDEGCPVCAPQPELCDGVDNDCDGVVDEGCALCVLAQEVCNGADNNCDALVDEGCPSCVPAPDVCDGVDNDCDFVVDEGCDGGAISG